MTPSSPDNNPVGAQKPGQRALKTLVGALVSLAMSAALLALIVYWKEIRLDALARHWQGADKSLLLLAFAVSALFHVLLGSHKLWLVLRAMGVGISYLDTMKVVLGMGPLQVLLPLKGGEVVAVLYFWRHNQAPLGNASGAIIFDRGLNFLAAALWLLLGLALQPGVSLGGNVTGLALGGVVVSVVLFGTPLYGPCITLAEKLHAKLGNIARAILVPWRELSTARRLFFLAYGLLVVGRPIVVCALLFAAFGQPIVIAQVLVYTGLAIFAGHLPGPLMGMGPREGAIVAISAAYAGGAEVALSIGVLLSLLVYIGPMLLGLPWLPSLLRGVLAGQHAMASHKKSSGGHRPNRGRTALTRPH